MKKTTILFVMALLCLNICSNAQEILALKLGDKLPELFWKKEYAIYKDGKTSTQNLSDYKEKLLIIDFWATWCTSCYHKFFFLDSLAKAKPKHFAVLMVNNKQTKDNLQKIKTRLADYAEGRPFGLATVYDDDFLAKLFPHQVVPQYVWVNKLGIVVAITGSDFINEESINNSIARFNKH